MRKPTRFKKLYRILHNLDCELQDLGIRRDWEVQANPDFARGTLLACIKFLSTEPEARRDYSKKAAQELLDREIHINAYQMGKLRPTCLDLADMEGPDEANDALFDKLFLAYSAKFTFPQKELASNVIGEDAEYVDTSAYEAYEKQFETAS